MIGFENLISLGQKTNIETICDNYSRRINDLIKGTAQLWNSGNTFRHACDISVLYASGLLPTSPYHVGPILPESTRISQSIIRCTRNGLLTVSSEPVHKDINIITGEPYEVKTSSLEFWIKNHNISKLTTVLDTSYPNRFNMRKLEGTTFGQVFGASYEVENQHVSRHFIKDTVDGTNDMFDILADISKNFTEYASDRPHIFPHTYSTVASRAPGPRPSTSSVLGAGLGTGLSSTLSPGLGLGLGLGINK